MLQIQRHILNQKLTRKVHDVLTNMKSPMFGFWFIILFILFIDNTLHVIAPKLA